MNRKVEAPPHSPEAIGRRMKKIRIVFDLSQAQVGVICHCGDTTVSNWEKGRQRPTILHAQLLADRFGLDLDYIYLGRLGMIPFDTASKLSEDDA